jgi:hypothetical protein
MHKVEPFEVGPRFKTDLWAATENVLTAMVKLGKRKHQMVMRFRALLRRGAQSGFDNLPANLIQHFDWQVYTFGDRQGSLLRSAGFFDDTQNKQTFILMDFYEKHGQKYRDTERERIIKIARIRNAGDWSYNA